MAVPYKYLVSACLAGINCNYRGRNSLKNEIEELAEKGEAIALCPEVLGGLGTPREDSEIVGGDGEDVLKKKARVLTISGKDVSREYIDGAKQVLMIAKRYKIKYAILKSRSPSCGFGGIYDGTFTKSFKKGDGVLAALLRKNKIKIYTEAESGKI